MVSRRGSESIVTKVEDWPNLAQNKNHCHVCFLDSIFLRFTINIFSNSVWQSSSFPGVSKTNVFTNTVASKLQYADVSWFWKQRFSFYSLYFNRNKCSVTEFLILYSPFYKYLAVKNGKQNQLVQINLCTNTVGISIAATGQTGKSQEILYLVMESGNSCLKSGKSQRMLLCFLMVCFECPRVT